MKRNETEWIGTVRNETEEEDVISDTEDGDT